jgi:hypothetical protein
MPAKAEEVVKEAKGAKSAKERKWGKVTMTIHRTNPAQTESSC